MVFTTRARSSPSAFIAVVVVCALALGVVSVYLASNDPSSLSSLLVGNLGIFLAFVFATVCSIRAARRPTSARRGWIGISVATGLSSLTGVFFIGSLMGGTEPTSTPTGVVGVISLVSYAVPLLAAMFWFPRAPQLRISRFRTILDAVVITIGIMVISQATVLHDVFRAAQLGTVTGWTGLAFPIADVVICAVVLTLGMRQDPANRLVWVCFGTGSVILAVTHSAFVVLTLDRAGHPGQLTGSLLAVGWMVAGALIGLSALVPTRQSSKPPRDLAVITQLVPYGPVLGALVILFVEFAAGDPLLLVGEIVLLMLVIIRQVIIVYENVNLTRHLEDKVADRTAELAEVGSIVNSSSDAIVGLSLNNLVTAWNPAAEQLYGRSAAAVMGHAPTFLSPEELAAVAGLLGSVSPTKGSKLAEYELDWRRHDGVTLPLAVTISPILDGERLKGISVFGRDVTERRRVEVALEQAREKALESSRLKSEFLATVSHEIRTPMNGVIGLTSLLLSTPLDDRQRQYVTGVQTAGEALLGLINDILDFSKLDAGKVELDPADFDLPEMIEELGGLLAPAAFAKRLELVAYCRPGVPQTVHGDAGRIRQIALNLASNAVKFTASGEVVLDVSTVAVDDGLVRLRFSVSDTGIGIAEADQQRVFESFSQADASTTRRFGGTGLGLAISGRLVETMGGEIGVTSALGLGSTFWFEIALPLGTAPAGAPPPLDPEVVTGRRVLVVDDSRTNLSILQAQLASWDLHADVAENARTALRRLRVMAGEGRPYDAAVLDLIMPDVDGLQLARIISGDRVLAGLPMIMLTSGTHVDPATLRSAGVCSSLSKPVRSSELRDGLVRLLCPQDHDGGDPRRQSVRTAVAT